MDAPAQGTTNSRLEVAVAIAREAGDVTLGYFCRDNYQVETKSDASPVTIADREAEQHLRRRIQAAFPDDAIMGEEFGAKDGTSGYRWILDPIDGTKSFIRGVPLYGTMVAVEHDGRGIVGAISFPPLGEMIYAEVGSGAWHQRGDAEPQRAKVSGKRTLAEALFVTTAVEGFLPQRRRGAYQALEQAALLTRTWGDCYGYLLVATGRAEVMIDPLMSIWDAAALQPILTEAGGTFTDWKGEPSIHNNEGVATNGHVLEEVLAITRQ